MVKLRNRGTQFQHKIQPDTRGSITTGEKTERGLPKAVGHFNVSKFREVIEVYGNTPTQFVIYLPSNNWMECFDDTYEEWGGNKTKKRSCNGEECTHRIEETINGVLYREGAVSECLCQGMEAPICSYSMLLKAYIASAEYELLSMTCYAFRSGSENNGENIRSALQKVSVDTERLYGQPLLMGIPFNLSVKMVSSRDSAKKKFPVWNIQPLAFHVPRVIGDADAGKFMRLGDGATSDAGRLLGDGGVTSLPPETKPMTRPLEPLALQHVMQAKVKSLEKKEEGRGEPDEDQMYEASTAYRAAFGDGFDLEEQQSMLWFLFQKTELVSLNLAEVQAFLGWVNLTLSGAVAEADPDCVKEVQLLRRYMTKNPVHVPSL